MSAPEHAVLVRWPGSSFPSSKTAVNAMAIALEDLARQLGVLGPLAVTVYERPLLAAVDPAARPEESSP